MNHLHKFNANRQNIIQTSSLLNKRIEIVLKTIIIFIGESNISPSLQHLNNDKNDSHRAKKVIKIANEIFAIFSYKR